MICFNGKTKHSGIFYVFLEYLNKLRKKKKPIGIGCYILNFYNYVSKWVNI